MTTRETTKQDDLHHQMETHAHGHFGARNVDHPPQMNESLVFGITESSCPKAVEQC